MTAPLAHTNTARVVGAVVSYHGSQTSEHYATFYIQAFEGRRVVITDRDYPAVGVLKVRPSSVTPTGRVLALCACLHDVERRVANHCGGVGCGCDDHGWNVR